MQSGNQPAHPGLHPGYILPTRAESGTFAPIHHGRRRPLKALIRTHWTHKTHEPGRRQTPPRHHLRRRRGDTFPSGPPRRSAHLARARAAVCRACATRQLRAHHLRTRTGDAPTAVDHARRPQGRLGRFSLQGRRPGHAPVGATQSRRTHQRDGPDRQTVSAAPRASAHLVDGRRRRHSTDGISRRTFEGGQTLATAGADGLRSTVPVQGATVAHPGTRITGRRDRRHAAYSKIGTYPHDSPACKAMPVATKATSPTSRAPG